MKIKLVTPKLKVKRRGRPREARRAQNTPVPSTDTPEHIPSVELPNSSIAELLSEGKGCPSAIPQEEERAIEADIEEDVDSEVEVDIDKVLEEDEVEAVSLVLVEADSLQGLEGCDLAESDLPLPALGKGTEEVKALIKQQSEDANLTELRRKGKRGIDGYMLDEGVLVHMKLADPGRQWTRVVVPTCRRKEVLDVGHRGLAGGHFSHNKMVISLSQHFTWPGLGKDARAYCSACPECQRSGRQLQPKAPLVPTPIIGVPYQRLACDLVGT